MNKSKCALLKELCEKDEAFASVSSIKKTPLLLEGEDKWREGEWFSTTRKEREDYWMTSGDFDEHIGFICLQEKVNIEAIVSFSDYYTEADEHKLAKAVRRAERLDSSVFSSSAEEMEDEDFSRFFSVEGVKRASYPPDAPDALLVERGKEMLDALYTDLSRELL